MRPVFSDRIELLSFGFQNDQEEQVTEDEHDVHDEQSAGGQSEDELQESEVINASTADKKDMNEENRSNSPIDDLDQETTAQADPTTTDPAPDQPSDDTDALAHPSRTDENEDADMEIIHHDIVEATEHDEQPTEEIHPQGLPIENKQISKNVSSKKITDAANR